MATSGIDSLNKFDASLAVPFGASAPVAAPQQPSYDDWVARNPGGTEDDYSASMLQRANNPMLAGDAGAPFPKSAASAAKPQAASNNDTGIGEIVGGITGAVAGSRAPKYISPDLTAAKADLAGKVAFEKSLVDTYQGGVNRLINEHKVANTVLEDARNVRDAAHTAARAVGLDPATISAEDLAGDKWNKKVVGSMGPGGDSVTEAARNYQVEKKLPTDYKATRSGIAVPRSYNEAPAVTQARQAVVDAEIVHRTAQTEAAAAQLAMDNARNARLPAPLANATAGKNAAQASVDELSKAKSFLSKIPGFNIIMGGLSGAELVHAYNELQAGNTLEGVMAGLSGIGGLVSMVPHPVAKAVGTAMALPPLAYQGIKAYKEHKANAFDPGKGEGWD
jgi:hypothetical protein